MPSCPKCGFLKVVKNGTHHGKQRYKCKSCGFQFTRLVQRGRPASEKATAVLLYTLGLSLSAIAGIFKVSTPAVLRWVRLFAEKTYEKPEPGEAAIVELDEMWHYLKTKKTISGSGRLIVAVPASFLIGTAGLVIKKRSQNV